MNYLLSADYEIQEKKEGSAESSNGPERSRISSHFDVWDE
jgi:hypothetical protein